VGKGGVKVWVMKVMEEGLQTRLEVLDLGVALDEFGLEVGDALPELLILGGEFFLALGCLHLLLDGVEVDGGFLLHDEARGETPRLGFSIGTTQPFLERERRLPSVGIGIQVVLEDVRLTWDAEGDGLHFVDVQLEGASNLALVDVQRAFRQERDTLLRSGRLVLRQVVEVWRLIHDFIVTDVTVSLARKEQKVRVVVEVGHDSSRRGVDVLVGEGFAEAAWVEDVELALARFGEPHCEHLLLQPANTRSLHALVANSLLLLKKKKFNDNAMRGTT
jgi:hypothetical protein